MPKNGIIEIKVAIPARRFEPPHVSGDLEFAGHGPDILISTKIDAVNAGRQLALEISMDAKETKQDWTHFNGSGRYVVYDVSDKYPNHRILDIVTDAFSSLYVQDHDHDAHQYPPSNGTLVNEFVIHGDQDGEDQPWVMAHFNEVTLRITAVA